MKNVYIIALMFAVMLTLTGVVLLLPSSFAANIVTPNYKNVTVHTYVNITNSRPEVLSVSIFDTINASKNITITSGGLRSVTCNATIRDWNGFNDIVHVNATLYYSFNQSTDPDNNNTHYTNYTCNVNSSIDGFAGYYTCLFNVYYYANNGTWACNVTAQDAYPASNSTGTKGNITYFYPVYSLNVTDGIDYGNIAVEEYSGNITANVTNFGNMGINISVEGYGATRGDGLAMNCSTAGNITVANEKFSASANADYVSKNALSSATQAIPGLMMPKQTIAGTPIINTTYWQLFIPPNPAGNCTGFILFSAQIP